MLYSALAPGGNATAIVNQIQKEMKNFPNLPATVDVDYTGEIEEQNKQQSFLIGAFFTGLALIFFILIFQFNSVFKARNHYVGYFLEFDWSLWWNRGHWRLICHYDDDDGDYIPCGNCR